MQAKAECIRKVENWTNIKNYHRFDKSTFDPKKMSEEIASFSPKLETLLNKIDELDKEDMDKDNRTYKHFIFSDVKKGGYGARVTKKGGYGARVTKKAEIDAKITRNMGILHL